MYIVSPKSQQFRNNRGEFYESNIYETLNNKILNRNILYTYILIDLRLLVHLNRVVLHE